MVDRDARHRCGTGSAGVAGVTGARVGWQISLAQGSEGYWLVETGEAGKDLGGAIMKRQAHDQVPVSYIQVESVADYAAKVGGVFCWQPSLLLHPIFAEGLSSLFL